MSFASLVAGIKALLPLLGGVAVAALLMTVWDWRSDSAQLTLLVPEYQIVVRDRDAKAVEVTVLTVKSAELRATIADLKAGIAEQNHAIELAEVKGAAIKAQQAQAQVSAAKLASQRDRRIAELEADLANASKTLTDLLDTSWRQHHAP